MIQGLKTPNAFHPSWDRISFYVHSDLVPVINLIVL